MTDQCFYQKQAAEENRLLYSIQHDNIKSLKNQQWAIASYIVAIYGAIIAIMESINIKCISNTFSEIILSKTFFIVIDICIACISVFFLWNLQLKLAKARRAIISFRKKFKVPPTKIEFENISLCKYRSIWYQCLIVFLLSIVIVSAALISIALILNK